MAALPPQEEDASPAPAAAIAAPTASAPAEKSTFDTSDRLVADTNALLAKLGFGDRAFASAADLVASVSSMSVALYEKLFQFRLRDVERVPHTRQDYEHNAQLVADALRSALLEQSEHGDAVDDELTGQRLCAGDLGSIRRLLSMLEQVYTLLFEESQEVGDRLRDVSLASLGMATTEVVGVSKRRVPPKFAKKQRKESRGTVESAPKSDDPERTSLREKRMNKEIRTARRSASQSRTSQKQEEVRVGRTVRAKEEMRGRRTASLSGTDRSRLDVSVKRADDIAENNKKRSRLLERSFRATSSSRAEIAAKEAATRKSVQGRSRVIVTATASGHNKQKEIEQDLLKTKKYGRFVAAAGSASSDEDKPRGKVSKEKPTEGKRDVFFEGVSSVQHNSDESMHFMEEEGAFAQNFSSISIEDAEPETKEGEAHAEQDIADQENARPNENTDPRNPVSHQKSSNHLEAEDEDGATSSPVKKKVARGEPRAPERPSSVRRTKRDQSKLLYPLLPKTKHAASTSKAQAQYLRYKLSLKNHLQELRQREAAQRQHLERAYKSGEHMANVDKIRSRRFEQDVRLHRIAIGLEAKNEEEKQLRQAMNHLLDLEKEKLREEHRMTTSVLKQIQKEHAEREQAMENFYANQIQLVKEQTRREAKERELVEKAQRSASEKMMRELRHERENQLAALLQEKQHLEETRKFRHASQMTQLLEKTDERSARRTDAFYTAAMKARERHTVRKQPTPRRTSLDPYRAGTKRPTRLSTSPIR
ncbi:Fanconi-associated nuclease 1 [Phytophthora cinnamomi]|uniref:Fanconi-associated nuclease 1 n=1 Tax=Phytophthora cinnamomi TaxID=4785 RepID=UPI00355A903D|nr:Fanconi-associated nuclease 1 [Phytophthora cinnamomi]